ncbi:APC family permease [Streptomyces sp. NPDC093600]|uniref:APC family permease n=1 Tax=Streptomyces sp. NPDC093600 TaxID=3366047 RepID=UPI0037FBD5DB
MVAEETGGAVPTAYLLAVLAMLFTAHSYGRMVAAQPVAGSAYTYFRRAVDDRADFLVGWVTLLDYAFLPMVIWLIGGAYLQAQFPGVPVPAWAWIVGFIVLTTAVNVRGIKTAERVNDLLMVFQILVIAIFVLLSLRHVLGLGGAGGLVSTTPFINDASAAAGISAGAAIAAYSFLGFDAVTTLTEETLEPRRTMPRAILIIALIGGAVLVAVACTTQLAHPGATFTDSGSAAFEIARTIGGDLFSSVFSPAWSSPRPPPASPPRPARSDSWHSAWTSPPPPPSSTSAPSPPSFSSTSASSPRTSADAAPAHAPASSATLSPRRSVPSSTCGCSSTSTARRYPRPDLAGPRSRLPGLAHPPLPPSPACARRE